MKYIVHQDTATWMRVTHEVEVDAPSGANEKLIEQSIIRDLQGCSQVQDLPVRNLNSTTPEEEEEMGGIPDRFELVRADIELTMEQHVHENLLDGSRGHFACSLGAAWRLADSANRAKIEAAFPHIFTAPEN